MKKWAFINDDFVLEENASIHYRDLSVQRGYGVFDFLKAVNRTPLFLEDHLNRFFYSAQQMHLPVAQTKKELQDIVVELLAKNGAADCGIRLTLTGGYSADGYQLARPNLIISQHAFQLPSEEQFFKGIHLMSHEHQRQLPQVKSLDYLMAIWLQPLLRQRQADDILYHHNGLVTECPRANFFAVTKDDRIVTPRHNILKGITRHRILELAQNRFEIEERDLTLQEVMQAREAFITSTTKNVLPVLSIDGTAIGQNTPGTLTRQLAALLQSRLQSHAPQHQ